MDCVTKRIYNQFINSTKKHFMSQSVYHEREEKHQSCDEIKRMGIYLPAGADNSTVVGSFWYA